MAGVDSGANRGQLRDTRKALFRSPDQDENSKTPGDDNLMLLLHNCWVKITHSILSNKRKKHTLFKCQKNWNFSVFLAFNFNGVQTVNFPRTLDV